VQAIGARGIMSGENSAGETRQDTQGDGLRARRRVLDRLKATGAATFLWDPALHRIAWATREALPLWGESWLADLIDRRFMPEDRAARALADAWRRAAAARGSAMLPSGLDGLAQAKPLRADLFLLADGRPGLLLRQEDGAAWQAAPPAAFDGGHDSALQLMANAAPMALALVGRDGRLIAANDAARALFAALGLDARAVDTLEARLGVSHARAILNAIRDSGQFVRTLIIMTALGQRLIRVAARATSSAPGAPALIAFNDVTEARLMEAERESDLRQLLAVLELLPDGVALADGDGVVIWANPVLASLPGAPQPGQRLAGCLPAPEAQRLDAIFAGQAGEDERAAFARGVGTMLHGAGGSVRRIELIVTSLPDGEDGLTAAPRRFAAILRDLTPQLQAAEELRRARDEALSADRRKSAFVANVSHELRTPLTAILGFSDLMREERFGPLGHERYRAYAEDINASGRHLLSLINDILDMSRIDAGKLELSFEEVDIADLARECARLMSAEAERCGITLEVRTAPGLPPVVADLRTMRQVVLNLLSNALKFTERGGVVSVLAALDEEGALTLVVRDSGIGMTPEELDLALTPYGQVRTKLGSGRAGTGLGLPIARALAEANRARFHLVSAPGKGTAASITFPAPQVLAG
jgi:signal transduction histidine kinase